MKKIISLFALMLFISISVNAQIVIPPIIKLPVELVDFSAILKSDKSVSLTWSTASEKNSSYFDIERSFDGTTFNRIGTIDALGNSSNLHTYSFTDGVSITAMNHTYYRLHQVDVDGTATYSPVSIIHRMGSLKLSIYPNPSNKNTYIQVSDNMVTIPVELLNANGQTIEIFSSESKEINSAFLLPKLPSGIYFLRCGSSNQRFVVE